MIRPGLERGWPAYQALPLSHAGSKGISLTVPLRLHLCLCRLHTHCFCSLFQTMSNRTTWLCCRSLQCKTFSAMFAQSNIAHWSLAFAFNICFKIINEVLPRENSVNTFIFLGFFKDIKWNLLCPEGLEWSWPHKILTYRYPNTRTKHKDQQVRSSVCSTPIPCSLLKGCCRRVRIPWVGLS